MPDDDRHTTDDDRRHPDDARRRPDRPRTDDAGSAPVDLELLDAIRLRLRDDDRFRRVEWLPDRAPNSVVVHYDLGYFPVEVEDARLRVCWYQNDDFKIHYEEQYADGRRWACRWDRHPNDHNARGHYHPAPDAAMPAEDRSYSDDWRDVLARVLGELDDHVRAFWGE